MVSVALYKSENSNKKLTAVFYDANGKFIKSVNFGATGYSDFTRHKNEQRKKRYLNRHRKNENWEDYMTAGSLSRWLLWNKTTLQASATDYAKRFNLTLLNPLCKCSADL